MSELRRRLERVTGGENTFPLLILLLIFFFDEFDTAAFQTLAPNIRHAFNLTLVEFGTIVLLNVSIVLGLAIPLGYLGDRVRRTRLVVVLGIVAAVFSFFTGLATAVGALVLVRIGNGFGRLSNDTVHPSLLSDYYRPEDRPQVFAWHRNGVYIGAIAGAAVAGAV